MRYVSASEAKQRLAAVLDAAQREPVTIRRQNREVAVVLSPRRTIGRGAPVLATGPYTVGRCTHGRFPTWIGEIA